MKKIIVTILVGILLISCSKNPLEKYAKDNNIELYTQSVDTIYCNIDSVDYYNRLVTNKMNELMYKFHINPDLPDDSILAYKEYVVIEPNICGEPNSLLYRGLDIYGNSYCIYALYDGRIISKEQYCQTYINFEEKQTKLAMFIENLLDKGV